MAHWQRRKSGLVYVYTFRDGKQVALPRDQTRHLDGEPDTNIQYWVDNWSAANEGTEPRRGGELTDVELLRLLQQFETYSLTVRAQKTVAEHCGNLRRYVLPFFASEEVEPNHWPFRSIRLITHLTEQGLQPRHINACNIALRKFWKYLTEEGIAQGDLRLRGAGRRPEATPLRYTITPQQVLSHVYGTPELRFIALVGFFFSLRPEEITAIRPGDLRAGSTASALECCRVMRTYKHFDRLAVYVSRQISQAERRPKSPKSGSKGFVACFSEKAAREIVQYARGRPVGEPILTHTIDWYYHLWRRSGFPDATIKDMRRASLYWLGHDGGLDYAALKNHARHRNPMTTALYLRRPEEDAGQWEELDLDA